MDINTFKIELKELLEETYRFKDKAKEIDSAIEEACAENRCPRDDIDQIKKDVVNSINKQLREKREQLVIKHLFDSPHKLVQKLVVNYQGTDVINHSKEDIDEYSKEFAGVVRERNIKDRQPHERGSMQHYVDMAISSPDVGSVEVAEVDGETIRLVIKDCNGETPSLKTMTAVAEYIERGMPICDKVFIG